MPSQQPPTYRNGGLNVSVRAWDIWAFERICRSQRASTRHGTVKSRREVL